MSVQSSLDPYGSNTTLASTASSDVDLAKKAAAAENAGEGTSKGRDKQLNRIIFSILS
jgi:hypothetical protein